MPWKQLSQNGSPASELAFNPIVKIVLIAGLALGLLIPLVLVQDLVEEREDRLQEVVREIGDLWGRPQTLAGPLLLVPASRVQVDEQGRRTRLEEQLVLLPDVYHVEAALEPERRSRGPFEAVVYRLNLNLTGHFSLPGRSDLALKGVQPDWTRARLLLGLEDQRRLTEAPEIEWDGRVLTAEPGLPSGLTALTAGGLQAELPLEADDFGRPLAFASSLTLNGSSHLAILPLGRTTSATITSTWPHPSFFGAFLPVEREVSDEGFTAHWSTSHFGRSYPQIWRLGEAGRVRIEELRASAFGVELYQPAGTYQQSERTTKYGLLFILFTFTLLFLYELISRRRLHILQYGLVGCALALFYLLLLALAEQMAFALAYAIAAGAVVAQLVFYTAGALGSLKPASGLGLLVAALYTGLFLLIGLEDLALLVGGIALFVALTAVMAVTRRIDWYAVAQAMKTDSKAEEKPSSDTLAGGEGNS
ncbi:MAG: cell envelope integrity protein CreD [Kiloniellales bacterium]